MTASCRRLLAAAVAALLAGGPAAAGASESTAVNEALLDALGRELSRSLDNLTLPGNPNPYFIGYKLTEVEINDASASLGSTLAARDRHFMNIEAWVHVGSYDLDNSNFVVARDEQTDGDVSLPLPLEATPAIARRAAWLVTDAAYKEALEQLTAKKATMRSGATGDSTVPSYSRMPQLTMSDEVDVPPLEAKPDLEARAQRISRVFRDQPHVRESRVAYTSYLERRWLMNSEGSRIHDVRRVTGVIIVATAQADDGQGLMLYATHYGRTIDDLPGEAELTKEAQGLAKTLDDLRAAPMVDNYTGPVLFEGEGATAVVRETLAQHLSGSPRPLGLGPDALGFGSAFADRIGLRVLSPLLSIVDDPTAPRFAKQAMIGGYRVDDEGVPAQRVEVVKDGALKTLLMSRVPSAQVAASNGHGRKNGPGVFHGSATNLILIGKKGLSRKALVGKLIAEVKAQGLPYGLIVKQLDDEAITLDPDLNKVDLVAQIQASDRAAPPPVLLAYRVFPNGREELVRGVELAPVTVRAWKDVTAVGKTSTVLNFLGTTDEQLVARLAGGGPGFVPSSGVESAIVAPDLLFKEIDVRRSTVGRRAPPAVPRP